MVKYINKNLSFLNRQKYVYRNNINMETYLLHIDECVDIKCRKISIIVHLYKLYINVKIFKYLKAYIYLYVAYLRINRHLSIENLISIYINQYIIYTNLYLYMLLLIFNHILLYFDIAI